MPSLLKWDNMSYNSLEVKLYKLIYPDSYHSTTQLQQLQKVINLQCCPKLSWGCPGQLVAGALPLIPRDTSIPPIVATQTQEAGIRHSGKLINLGPEIQRGAPRSNQYQSSSSSLILEIRNGNTKLKKKQLYYTFTSNDRYGLNLAKCVCFLVSKVGQELIRRMGDHYIGLAPPFAPQLPTSYSIYQLFARNAVTDWTIVIISSFLIIASILGTARYSQ